MFAEHFSQLKFADFSLGEGTFMTVFGIFDCILLCLNTKNCFSFSYSHTMRTCGLSPARYHVSTKLPLQIGMNYYVIGRGFREHCQSSADCYYQNSVCRHGSCRCAVGYSYQPINGSCVTKCGKYGRNFAVLRNHAIGACNSRTVKKRSIISCTKACLEEAEFVCVNVEYRHYIGTCNLCNTAWFDIPKCKRNRNAHSWTLFHRHCSR